MQPTGQVRPNTSVSRFAPRFAMRFFSRSFKPVDFAVVVPQLDSSCSPADTFYNHQTPRANFHRLRGKPN